jgi:hypothetical protein
MKWIKPTGAAGLTEMVVGIHGIKFTLKREKWKHCQSQKQKGEGVGDRSTIGWIEWNDLI